MIVTVFLVVLPVFFVIGAGWLATRSGVFSSSAVDGLMVYTQSFAVPCLLFRGLVDLDFGQAFDPRLLLSFYSGAVAAFSVAVFSSAASFAAVPARRLRSVSAPSSRTPCSSVCRS